MLISIACHIHSSWSYDGSWSLSAIATELARRGYRVGMITEHDRGFDESRRLAHRQACMEASTPKVLLIPGLEYSDASNTVHVLVWGSVPFLGENMETSELLRTVKAANGIAVLAHPSRRNAWQLFQPQWSEYLTAVEVWNRKTDGWAPSPDAQPIASNYKIAAYVGMDFHTKRQLFPLAMQVQADGEVTEELILEALRAGRASPTAFGAPIDGALLRRSAPFLAAAELARRTAAWTYRKLPRHDAFNAFRRNADCKC